MTLQNFSFENDLLYKISSGEIDCVPLDSQQLMLELKNYPGLVAELPLTDIQNLAWGVEKGKKELSGVIFKFFQYYHNLGLLDKLFQKYILSTLDEYYRLIGYNNGPTLYQLDLNEEESVWLNEKWNQSKLTIATVETKEIYFVEEDGTISGFDYNLAKNFALTLGLTLDIRLQDNVTNFFAKNGIFDTIYHLIGLVSLIEKYRPSIIEITGCFDYPIKDILT